MPAFFLARNYNSTFRGILPDSNDTICNIQSIGSIAESCLGNPSVLLELIYPGAALPPAFPQRLIEMAALKKDRIVGKACNLQERLISLKTISSRIFPDESPLAS